MCFGHEKSADDIQAIAKENFRRIGENFTCAAKTASMTFEELRPFVEFVGPPGLLAPPSDEGGMEDDDQTFDGQQDPMYTDAVRVVLEMGKASTSTLQRRLRLGYGRAARILDMMQRDGIIGPPDGSKPREVLKRPDWLEEVETLR